MKRPEQAHQKALMDWLEIQHPEAFAHTIHVPNEGTKSKVRGAILKGQGVKAGVPDVLCFLSQELRGDDGPIYWALGLAIELKIKPNVCTLEQAAWLRRLDACGWRTAVCWSWEEARDVFNDYLQGS